MNLLSKLSEKIKVQGKSIIKKFLQIALATAITFGVAGCSTTNTPTNSQSNLTSSTTSSQSAGSSSSSSEIEQYSQILQNVLTDSYYDEILAITGGNSHPQITQAIPYAFLQKKGKDIDAIKNEDIYCYATSYIKNKDTNSLYVSCRLENKATETYYSCYVLKYPLTKQEYDDYIMLHKGQYVQAPLFVQELAKQKTPVVISEINLTKSTLDSFTDTVKGYADLSTNAFNTTDLVFDVIKIEDIGDYKHNLYIDIRNSNYKLFNTGKQRSAILTTNVLASVKLNNNIYSIFDTGRSKLSNYDEYLNNAEDITMFYSNNNNHLYNLDK